MINIERHQKQEHSVSSEPMDSDESNPRENYNLENESIAIDRSGAVDSSTVKEHSEQQARNSDIMRKLE